MKLIRTLITIAVTLCMSFVFAYADDEATLVLEPEHPEPNSSVTITLESFAFDVDVSEISWKINGAPVLSGIGEKKLMITTGGIGSNTLVEMSAKSANGYSITQRINITPASVVVMYEAPNNYVPLLYQGRSLPSVGAKIRVTAFPQISEAGRILPASSLAYYWYVNDSAVSGASGYNKQSATLDLDYLTTTNEIKVIIKTPLGNQAEKTITITPHNIMPLVYESDEILGTLFTKLIEKRYEAIKDFSISLEPFYITKQKGKDLPQYTWTLDDTIITPADGRTMVFSPKKNTFGSQLLTISAIGPELWADKAENVIEFIFDTRK